MQVAKRVHVDMRLAKEVRLDGPRHKTLGERLELLARTHASTIRHFRSPNMPWKGELCRSPWAGLSGAAYMLPALACTTILEQGIWVVAAFLSVWADYVHIHHDSIFHGLDRCYATCIMAWAFALGAWHLEPWVIILGTVPLCCFAKGRDAKAHPTPSAWVFWHFWWHISGGLLTWWGMWQIHGGGGASRSRLNESLLPPALTFWSACISDANGLLSFFLSPNPVGEATPPPRNLS